MAKKKCKIVSDDYTVAMILSLIHQEYYGFNPENKIALFLITDCDLLTLSGLAELTDKFIYKLKNELEYLGFNFDDVEYGWLLSHREDFECYPRLPAKLVESMQSGFVNKYFDESVNIV